MDYFRINLSIHFGFIFITHRHYMLGRDWQKIASKVRYLFDTTFRQNRISLKGSNVYSIELTTDESSLGQLPTNTLGTIWTYRKCIPLDKLGHLNTAERKALLVQETNLALTKLVEVRKLPEGLFFSCFEAIAKQLDCETSG